MRGTHLLERTVEVPLPREAVFPFFAEAGNLARLTPPWLGFEILTPAPIPMAAGAVIDYRIRLAGLPLRWRTVIARWDPPDGFVDVQARGPYRLWEHHHRFEDRGDATRIEDRVRYRLPLYPLGEVALPLVRRQLDAIFDYRERVIHDVFPAAGRPDDRHLDRPA